MMIISPLTGWIQVKRNLILSPKDVFTVHTKININIYQKKCHWIAEKWDIQKFFSKRSVSSLYLSCHHIQLHMCDIFFFFLQLTHIIKASTYHIPIIKFKLFSLLFSVCFFLLSKNLKKKFFFRGVIELKFTVHSCTSNVLERFLPSPYLLFVVF
jgi:hypothetical protein